MSEITCPDLVSMTLYCMRIQKALCASGVGPIMHSVQQVRVPTTCQSHGQVSTVYLSLLTSNSLLSLQHAGGKYLAQTAKYSTMFTTIEEITQSLVQKFAEAVFTL